MGALLVAAITCIQAPLGAEPPVVWSEALPLAERSLLLDAITLGDDLFVVGERGHVLVSSDQAASWDQRQVPTRSTLTALAAIDATTLVAVGHDGVMIASTDRGRSWRRRVLDPSDRRPLLDLWLGDRGRGVAIGAFGRLTVTQDGGENWHTQPLPGGDPHLNAIAAAPDGSLYIVGELGLIMRSDDEGASWQRLQGPYRGSLFGVLPLRDGAILAFGLRGRLLRSTDRGKGWQEVPTGTRATLLAGLELAGGRVVLAGLEGALLLSRDHGRTVEPLPAVGPRAITALVELAGEQVMAVGEGGSRLIGLPAAQPARAGIGPEP